MKKILIKIVIVATFIPMVYPLISSKCSAEEIGIPNSGGIGDWPWDPSFDPMDPNNMASIQEVYNGNGGQPPSGYPSWTAYGESQGDLT